MQAQRPVSQTSQALTIGQFAFSGLALAGFWSLAAVFAAIGLTGLFNRSSAADAAPDWTRAVVMALLGLLFLPSVVFSLLRLLKVRAPSWLPGGQIRPTLFWALIPLWIAVLVLGNWAATAPRIGQWFLPVLDLLAVGLPILFLVSLGSRGLSAGSPQRVWGIFNTGMFAGPLLSLIAEFLVFVILIVVLVIMLARDPVMMETFNRLTQRLANSQADPEALKRILSPYLASPAVIFSGLALIAGVFPLIEELLKPIGLWFLLGRSLTPGEGFTGGMLSGAGFALMESLGTTSNSSGGDWFVVALARGGTDLVHILCSGLVGWGLVSAWKNRRFLHLGLAYLAAVAIHGLWNTISLLVGVLPLVNQPVEGLPLGVPQSGLTFAALGGLFVVLFLILIGVNRRLSAANTAKTGIVGNIETAPPVSGKLPENLNG